MIPPASPGGIGCASRPAVRRALVHRVLRVSIATAVVIAAVIAGLLISLAAPVAVAVMAGVTAASAVRRSGDAWSMPPTGGRSDRGWPAMRTSAGSGGA